MSSAKQNNTPSLGVPRLGSRQSQISMPDALCYNYNNIIDRLAENTWPSVRRPILGHKNHTYSSPYDSLAPGRPLEPSPCCRCPMDKCLLDKSHILVRILQNNLQRSR